MTAPLASPAGPSRVEELQARIRGMQASRLESKAVPTHAAFEQVLPGGTLREGTVVTVERSTTLLMALLAGPSASGRWVAVVGLPDFGVEAAARFGIALDRLVLVPDPRRQWLTVVAALADVIPVVAVRPAGPGAPAQAPPPSVPPTPVRVDPVRLDPVRLDPVRLDPVRLGDFERRATG